MFLGERSQPQRSRKRPFSVRADTPRPDARNVVVYVRQVRSDSSGFRFWDDDGDGQVEAGELGRIRSGSATDIDFFVDRDGTGDPVSQPGSRPEQASSYMTTCRSTT